MPQHPLPSPPRHGLLFGLIALLHLALWWLPVAGPMPTGTAWTVSTPAREPQPIRLHLRLLSPAAAPRPVAAVLTSPQSPRPPRPAWALTTQPLHRSVQPVQPDQTDPTDQPAPSQTEPAPAPARWQAQAAAAEPSASTVAPAASSPVTSARQLLDSAATRQALRAATRAPLLSERADAAAQAPERPQASARLGLQIQRAGHGDCLKGEFAGAGAGLLSLPFWALAEATGKCRK